MVLVIDQRSYTVKDFAKVNRNNIISNMFRQIMTKAANAGTIALLGYEVGSHVEQNGQEKSPSDNKHSEIVIGAIILLVIMVVAILTKYLTKKRQLV